MFNILLVSVTPNVTQWKVREKTIRSFGTHCALEKTFVSPIVGTLTIGAKTLVYPVFGGLGDFGRHTTLGTVRATEIRRHCCWYILFIKNRIELKM